MLQLFVCVFFNSGEVKGEFFCELCCVSASTREMYDTHMNGTKHKSKVKRLGPKVPGVEEGPKVMMDGTIMLGSRPINFPPRGGGRGGMRGGRGGGGMRGGGYDQTIYGPRREKTCLNNKGADQLRICTV